MRKGTIMDTNGLAQYTEQAFKATEGLIKLVPEDKLGRGEVEGRGFLQRRSLLLREREAEVRELPPGLRLLDGKWYIESVPT